jgi:hypothetical protein
MICILPIYCFSQTCIVALKSKDRIVVGGESRVAFSGINTLTGQVVEKYEDSICKIVTGKNINFAISGFPGVKLLRFGRNILNDTVSFQQFEDRYMRGALEIVKKSFDNEIQILNGVFDNKYPTESVLTDIILFGRENDSLKMIRLSLVLRKGNNNLRFFEWYNDTLKDTLISGETKELEYNNKNILYDNNTWKNGTIKGIEYIINYVHTLHPTHVGGPINIVEVTKRKTKWIGKKPPCY